MSLHNIKKQMRKPYAVVFCSTRVGKFFRSVTGNYNDAAPAGNGAWVIHRRAINKVNRHSANFLRKFRQAGTQTVQEAQYASALFS